MLSTAAATHLSPPGPEQADVLVFQEQPAHNLQKAGWAKRALSFKCWRSVTWLLIVSDHRSKDKEAGEHCCCISPYCCELLPDWLKWPSGDLKGMYPFHPTLIFLFSSFGSQILKSSTFKTTFMGKIRNSPCMHREKHSLRKKKKKLRRPKVYTSGWSLAQGQHTTIKNKKDPEEGKNLIPELPNH